MQPEPESHLAAEIEALRARIAELEGWATARRQAEEVARALVQVGRDLVGTLDLAQATDRVVSTVLPLFRVRGCVLFRLDRATGSLVCVAVAGGGDPGNWLGQTLPAGAGVAGRAVAESRPVSSSDLLADSRITLPEWVVERIREEGFQAAASVPLTVRGRAVGALSLADIAGRVFTQDDLALLSAFADHAALALENARLYGEAERRQREAEGSEQRFRDLVHGLDAIVWEADLPAAAAQAGAATLRFSFVSRRAEATLGYPVEQWLSEPDFWVNRIHPDDREQALASYLSATKHERDREFEYRTVAADGRVVWLRDMVHVVLGAGGRSRRLRGVMVDITERKRMEEALRKSEEHYRMLAEAAHDMIFIIARDDTVQYANSYAAKQFGRRLEELVGQPREALFPPDVSDRQQRNLRKVLETGESLYVEDKTLFLERQVWLGTWLVPIRNDAGEVTAVLGISRDITGRKQAEEERARLSMAVEQAAESIIITSTDGTILYVNPMFEQVSGFSQAEVIGRNPRILKSGNQDEGFYRAMWATLTRGGVWTGRFINRRKDGTLYEEEAIISPVRDAEGRVVNYVAVKRDVTYERRMEEQLRQSQRIEAVGRLAGGVAHDFNNLLTVITGRTQLLLLRLRPEDPLRPDIALILKTTERAAELTRQLLAFSRKQVLQPKVLDLSGIVASMEPMLRRLIGEHIDLAAVRAPALGRVKADPGQIEQVIMNLAVNARDAMPRGGRLTIEATNADLDETYASRHVGVRPGPYVMLAVSDTGCGMDVETQSHIFEPFFTTKGLGKGTGLGLSTVYGIVKQTGGNIWVYSEPGRGTTFKLYLPRVEDPVDRAEPGRPPIQPHHGWETLLLAEDEGALRDLFREVLLANGYTVLEARHGGEALRVAERHAGPIHLLITDVIMPQMGGRELAQRLAPLRPTMKVLYISGYPNDAVVHHGVLDPGTAFLQKPFAPDALVRKVREVLDALREEEPGPPH